MGWSDYRFVNGMRVLPECTIHDMSTRPRSNRLVELVVLVIMTTRDPHMTFGTYDRLRKDVACSCMASGSAAPSITSH